MDSLFWYGLGFLGAVLTSFGLVPQIIKMVRTKRVRDVSLGMLIQYWVGVFLWFAYGIHLQDIVLILSNLVCILVIGLAVLLFFYYREGEWRVR